MIFKKLEIVGFKSFAEKINFFIENGLTGIVGPNGCGKSNIVEAIRWCMGETSAKSMRGTGMEDVIFSGTANTPSKNIAEVTLTLDNSQSDGPIQYKDDKTIEVKRRIEKEKGSKYYINGREVRARDAQTLFADLSTGAHSPSMISQGRIGSLVTAKPNERRSILEEAAGISGIHVRRHEAELRLNSAENNLKRADELRRQQERQLENLKKQAEEALKFKQASEEIKRIEAGLYYLKIKELKKEIKVVQEIVNESDNEVSGLTIEINHNNDLLKNENEKLRPLRDHKVEIHSKIQRLNLEIKNLEDQEKRNEEEKSKLLKSKKIINEDLEREKNIIIDAISNKKRLVEEKNNLITNENKYLEIEIEAEKNLKIATEILEKEQNKLEQISNEITKKSSDNENKKFFEKLSFNLMQTKDLVANKSYGDAVNKIDDIVREIKEKVDLIETNNDESLSNSIMEMTKNMKKYQENYAVNLSKSQSIKTDSIKRKERLLNIEKEIESWDKFKTNSEKTSSGLNKRLESIENDINLTSKIPEKIAIQKGQLIQSENDTKKDLEEISNNLSSAETKYNEINSNIQAVQEKMINAREKRARSIATEEGLKIRKKDLSERIAHELNIEEENLLKFSDLENADKLPDPVEQEEKLDKKKRQRESLGSVNLRADEETKTFKDNIIKMEKDREDLVTAIIKLRSGINELNQKGRERLIEAFDKVNRKFSEVYKKLFNGGTAKLELVDSDDPLEAGLEMLVSPPGKRLQSITLLSGGEQALTALALIFAVFLTSPAPICVLDEVDAPLDDANVTRFCSLLNELIKITSTKFIIITHHALTMSRMNRLYGVTMPKKGISQLVAVNLEKAEELVA